MPSEAIPVRGGELIVLHASADVAFVVEEAARDRITIRLVPTSAADPGHRKDLLAHGASEDVIDAASRLNILDHLATALAVVRGCFPTAKKWTLTAHERPAQIEINVLVAGTAEEVYRRHSDCVDRWVKLLPAEVLGKIALTEDFA